MTPIKESVHFQLKLEMLNAFNRHAFALPDVTPTDKLFGVSTATLTTARNLQITGRVSF
jgi:hypothetical protein